MTISVLDTNVLLRWLVNDQADHYRAAAVWFREAERGARTIIVTPVVIAEVSFVLEFFYKKKRADIAAVLEVFLNQRWLKVEERSVLVSLWTYYRRGLHFVDSYLCAWAQVYGGNVLTFDEAVRKLADK